MGKGDLTNEVTHMAKPSRENDMKACHTMNQRSTNDKGIEMDKLIKQGMTLARLTRS
jgi:membrane protein required for beta-lactamase induction